MGIVQQAFQQVLRLYGLLKSLSASLDMTAAISSLAVVPF